MPGFGAGAAGLWRCASRPAECPRFDAKIELAAEDASERLGLVIAARPASQAGEGHGRDEIDSTAGRVVHERGHRLREGGQPAVFQSMDEIACGAVVDEGGAQALEGRRRRVAVPADVAVASRAPAANATRRRRGRESIGAARAEEGAARAADGASGREDEVERRVAGPPDEDTHGEA